MANWSNSFLCADLVNVYHVTCHVISKSSLLSRISDPIPANRPAHTCTSLWRFRRSGKAVSAKKVMLKHAAGGWTNHAWNISSVRSKLTNESNDDICSHLGGTIKHLPCFFKMRASQKGTVTWIWGRKGPNCKAYRKERKAEVMPVSLHAGAGYCIECWQSTLSGHKENRSGLTVPPRRWTWKVMKGYSHSQWEIQTCIWSSYSHDAIGSVIRYLRERECWQYYDFLVFSEKVHLLVCLRLRSEPRDATEGETGSAPDVRELHALLSWNLRARRR